MKQLTLVDHAKLKKNPRGLLYLYPSIPAIRYKKIADRYHENYALDVAEQLAKMFGCHLVPAACIHHSRKVPSRRIMIYGRSYYAKRPDELSKTEMRRFLEHVRGEEDDEG